LFYRLKVIPIQIPPLRERREDLPDLVRYFLRRYADKTGKAVVRVSREAMSLLYAYHWPGNIRELENAIERAFAMTSTTVLFPEDFPAEIAMTAPGETSASITSEPEAAEAAKSLEQMERAHIVRILQEVNFNKSKAAEVLGIDRATLYRKAQRYSIRLAEEK
jgi:DNA-binding NtrC family response regulator